MIAISDHLSTSFAPARVRRTTARHRGRAWYLGLSPLLRVLFIAAIVLYPWSAVE